MYGNKTSKLELFSHCGEFFDMCAIEYPYQGTPISPLSLTFSDLRGCHCKYRESVDRLKQIENPDFLAEEHFWGVVFENIT